ncbi:MAG: formate dehydrogenase subunit delta [Planctomycetes bacterium]|nr:formate dehydrogenase subunit delta [Planctomycetota bacterium]
MDGRKLVRMANDIAAFFAAEPERKVALDGIASHLRRFWEPRMRREILALLDQGGEGMSEHVRDALRAHRRALEPAAR